MKMNEALTIRQAVIDDVPVIFNLIKEFAEYNQSTDRLVATEETLREFLFGERQYAEVLLGYLNGKPIGYVLFTHNFSTLLGRPGLYLVDIYIEENARRKGVGKIFMQYMAKIAKTRKFGRFEWSVLKVNKSAINFYKSIGGNEMSEWITYRVDGEKLEHLANLNGAI